MHQAINQNPDNDLALDCMTNWVEVFSGNVSEISEGSGEGEILCDVLVKVIYARLLSSIVLRIQTFSSLR